MNDNETPGTFMLNPNMSPYFSWEPMQNSFLNPFFLKLHKTIKNMCSDMTK